MRNETPTGARRRLSPILSRHLLREFSVPLFGSLAAFLAISLLLAVFDDLPDFSGVEIPATTTVLYFLARTPDYLITVFPISALLAVSFMTIVLGKNQELTAMRSAGISLLAAATPVWILAIVLCAGSSFLAEVVHPASVRFVETVWNDYLNNPAAKKSSSAKAEVKPAPASASGNQLAYFNPRKRQEWFFADFRPRETCHGISITIQDELGRPVSVFTAAEGDYDIPKGGWRFRQTSLVRYDYSSGELPTVLPPEFHECFPEDATQVTKLYGESPRDILIQSTPIEQTSLRGLLRLQRRKILLASQNLSLIRTLLAYHLTSPLAPLIAVLLGFALTMPKGRTSAIQGFVLAVALYVAYTLLAQFFLVLGKNGYLWWPLAGALPTLAALATAFTLAWKRQ